MALRAYQASGLEYLDLATALLQGARRVDPTGGVWEAADLQWWWRGDQHRDPIDQTFWLRDDTPLAAAIFTVWGDRWSCDLICEGHDVSGILPILWPRVLRGIDARRDKPVEMIVRDDDFP